MRDGKSWCVPTMQVLCVLITRVLTSCSVPPRAPSRRPQWTRAPFLTFPFFTSLSRGFRTGQTWPVQFRPVPQSSSTTCCTTSVPNGRLTSSSTCSDLRAKRLYIIPQWQESALSSLSLDHGSTHSKISPCRRSVFAQPQLIVCLVVSSTCADHVYRRNTWMALFAGPRLAPRP